MKETIPVLRVEKGMFVLELDRPWLETPFLMQGFLVEDDDQIDDLRKCCKMVTIDRSRSVGKHFRAESHIKTTPRRTAPPAKPVALAEEAGIDFGLVLKTLRDKTPKRQPNRTPPKIQGPDQQSRIEEELLYSAPIVDDVKKKLRKISAKLDTLAAQDIQDVVVLVAEMAEAVERNPDAMIWLARLRSTDEYSYDHAVDVSVHLMVLARFLGMPPATVEMLGQVGLMQDIGKVALPETVLTKTEALTEDELALVHSHVASSLQILSKQRVLSFEALAIVGSHHERIDGSGYPRRIQGEKISLHAELAGMIDSYCAMTRKRAYRAALSNQQALESLIGMRGTKFRAPLVDQLVQCLGLYPIGSLVELNTGEVGVVIQQNSVRRLKPRVMVLLNPDKSVERRPRTLDLIMDPASPEGQPYHIVRSLPMNAYGINPADFYLG